jgi:NAD(P)-dependent dehydrogenase (short-subunit alcohol dehydrogenase family)
MSPDDTEPASAAGLIAGRVCLVTGAGSGVGRAIAQVFAAEGGRLVVLDYFEEAARETVASIEKEGREAFAVRGDVTSASDLDAAVALAVERFGGLDVLASNAGIFDQNAPCEETDEELWDRVLDVNVKGAFLASRRALREMLPKRAGSIVITSSVAGMVGLGGGLAYTTSKAALVGLTRQLACEVADRGVRVNAIAPGVASTQLFEKSAEVLGRTNPHGPMAARFKEKMIDAAPRRIPMGRFAEPEEVARAAVFLASDYSSYVTGHVLAVDGGYLAR